ncbi:hypothetical protein KY290_005115 [Solanum tuberosum]|uniref:Uncharacterized protein n=1 Tax=Solanum tuberosum TaxID=4113 RepID=A0ABQ7WD78_SOLTU|nr:hypothetical protein KY290_005115 [Solanum tuberosum]
MAIEPSGMQLRSPDQSQSTRNSNINKPQLGASSESSDNSSKMQRIEAIHVAISEEELDWAGKVMSLEQSGMILQGVHLTEISNHFDGEISGDIKSDKVTGAPVNNGNEESHQMTPCDEDNLCKGKMQGNQEATTKGTQAAHHTNAKDQTGISNVKQHGKGQCNKAKRMEGNNQTTPTRRWQAGGDEVNEQTGKITHKGHDIDPKIPPPIKVSSNFDIYRPSQQRTNQNCPKQNQNKTYVNSTFKKKKSPNPGPLSPYCIPILSY